MPFQKLVYVLLVVAVFNSCSNGKKIYDPLAKKDQPSTMPDSLVKKQSSGIDFYASGNVPIPWTLDMDIDGVFFLQAGDIKVSVAAVKPTIIPNSNVKLYHSSTTNGDMKINIYNEACVATGQSQKVEVMFNNTHYSGCGSNLFNPQLNGNWVLEKNGKEELKANDFPRGLPVLIFNLNEQMIRGIDGCDNISGPMTVVGSRINFGVLTISNASCKNESVKNIFKSKLSNYTADYFFKDGKLILYLVDDSQLTFRKAN